MQSRLLKPYKGFSIEKSWETKADGTMDKETVVYTAYTSDGNLFDAAKTLSAIREILQGIGDVFNYITWLTV